MWACRHEDEQLYRPAHIADLASLACTVHARVIWNPSMMPSACCLYQLPARGGKGTLGQALIGFLGRCSSGVAAPSTCRHYRAFLICFVYSWGLQLAAWSSLPAGSKPAIAA